MTAWNMAKDNWAVYVKQVAKKRKRQFENREEFYSVIEDMIEHDVVQDMKNYNHHSQTNCFTHCVHVAYYNYKVCKWLKLDATAGARAGLVHDLFLYDWHSYKPKKGERLHGFEHPKKALVNARANFQLTDVEEDMISKHMFPLTLSLPRYKETAVIIMTDKFCSSCEVLDRFFKEKSRKKVRMAKIRKKYEKMK